ncbi:MAG: hypothetical protein ACI9LO_003030 [Planctomycetota bacterium]|jgi:hypothetical protein
MEQLQNIVYVSTQARELDDSDIEYLLKKARERNLEYNITGLLLLCHGCFMQYIEGEKTALNEIYKIILEDKTHRHIIECLNEEIDKREFSEWSMAYSKVEQKTFDDLSNADWLEKKGSPDGYGKPMLFNFWKTNNRHRKR